MSFSPNIPEAALDTVVALLLPLILPGLNGDAAAARALALRMLDEYHPASMQELRLAAEAIGCSLKGLACLAQSAEPGIRQDKLEFSLKWACGLTRAGHQAQRRLRELQRLPKTTCQDDPAPESAPAPKASAPRASAPRASAPEASAPEAPPAGAAAEMPPPAAAPDTELAQAEKTFNSALKLLNMMKSYHKGAPPPHSQAAQQIQDQHRVVETARLKLEQVRRRHARATVQAEATQAAA